MGIKNLYSRANAYAGKFANTIGTELAERRIIPDSIIRYATRQISLDHLNDIRSEGAAGQENFVNTLHNSPIAIETKAANDQHYEVPARFFDLTLGENLKYSCAYFENKDSTLNQAEASMLSLCCSRAEIENGMNILELGCGWGSMTLWIAEQYPNAQITAISNSHSQREFIEARAAQKNLDNVTIITANAAEFDTEENQFDRVVSIEMFEHMRNWGKLYANISRWLKPDGKFFQHVFTHKKYGYLYKTEGEGNWMAKHFFTGGIMPSFDLPKEFNDDLVVENSWFVNGKHYARTSAAWLKLTDKHEKEILQLFKKAYGKSYKIWFQRWRMFYLAVEEFFGLRDGKEWGVGHYLLSQK